MRITQLQNMQHSFTPNHLKNSFLTNYQKTTTNQSFQPLTSLKTKSYSFQDLPCQSIFEFCKSYQHMNSLIKVGKRITDPNVLLLNSTQKQMVEMIIDNNKQSKDQKSKYLTQRAGKYLRILWKSQKFNDCYEKKQQQEKQIPRYASPIHNFRRNKLITNNQLESISNITDKSAKSVASKNKSPTKRITEKLAVPTTSRSKRILSEDHKFQKIKISPSNRNKITSKQRQKSFEIDLTKSIAWKTMSTTKNFQNMLKILRKQK